MNANPEQENSGKIGHEARRPLIHIIETVDLLLDEQKTELPEAFRADLQLIKDKATNALSVVDDLIERLQQKDR